MSVDPSAIDFKPVGHAHYALLESWLRTPHWQEWWGEPDHEMTMIRDMVEGRDSARPYLIRLNREPVGYIQYWMVADQKAQHDAAEEPWLDELADDAIGIDLSIGTTDHLSKGLGSAALTGFVERLRASGKNTLIIDPSPENKRAIRAYEKAGFRVMPEMTKWQPAVLLMQHQSNVSWTSP